MVFSQEANAKLVLGTIYLLLGLGIISMCFNLMQEKIISQVLLLSRSNIEPLQVRLLARSLGLIREYRDLDEDPLP